MPLCNKHDIATSSHCRPLIARQRYLKLKTRTLDLTASYLHPDLPPCKHVPSTCPLPEHSLAKHVPSRHPLLILNLINLTTTVLFRSRLRFCYRMPHNRICKKSRLFLHIAAYKPLPSLAHIYYLCRALRGSRQPSCPAALRILIYILTKTY